MLVADLPLVGNKYVVINRACTSIPIHVISLQDEVSNTISRPKEAMAIQCTYLLVLLLILSA